MPPSTSTEFPFILITGATGYIGGRLLNSLKKEPYPIRCLLRHPQRLKEIIDLPHVEIMQGDIFDKDSLIKAMQGIQVAFYLIHSMQERGGDFSEKDRIGAINFAQAAQICGVKRIIYLGGLGNYQEGLSKHLESRQEVGTILREQAIGVQVIEFRASIVIGSGSLSFELIRSLCERLPIMITPKWVWTMAQPISITDLLNYFKKAITKPLEGNPIFEIGGKDQVSYGGIMLEYMRQRNLKRWLIPVPILSPRLSSWWLGLITPVYAKVGRELIDSARISTVVRDSSAQHIFDLAPMGIKEAIASALSVEDKELVQSHWSNALSSYGDDRDWTGIRFGNRIVNTQIVEVPVIPAKAFAPIQRLGGHTGWYYGNSLWHLRGVLDLLFGGVGLRRGRSDPDHLHVGDVLDFWRVEAYEPDRILLLQAEMKLPGRAWLEFTVEPTETGSRIQQKAIFDPIGLSGLLYWYILYPVHYLIFKGMIKGIADAAQKSSGGVKKQY